jgi:hypothetical protein
MDLRCPNAEASAAGDATVMLKVVGECGGRCNDVLRKHKLQMHFPSDGGTG